MLSATYTDYFILIYVSVMGGGVVLFISGKMLTLNTKVTEATCFLDFYGTLTQGYLLRAHMCPHKYEVKGHLGIIQGHFQYMRKCSLYAYIDGFSWDLNTRKLG